MRRVISIGSVAIAIVVLGIVLYNATLVDRKPPTIARVTLSAPAGDDRTGQSQTAIDIEFSERVRPASVEQRFRIDPYVAGGFTWDGSVAIFTPSSKLPPDTAFTVSIEPGFEDLVGNAAPTGLAGWTFRTVGPPTVAAVEPADGAIGIGVDSGLTIRFDRLMDTGSVESALRVTPAVAFRAAWSGETLRLTFEPALGFGTSYTVTVGTAAADTGGTHLPAPFVAHFSTVAAGLAVVNTVPADHVAGVSVRTQIGVVFDAPIDPTTAANSLTITPSVGGETRVVSLADDRASPASPTPGPEAASVLVFTPGGSLAANTTYTVTLNSVVARRTDPGQVAAGRTWTFTTGAPSTSGQNQIAFLSARSGVRNVWLMNPDGTNQRQVTTSFVPVSAFDATADGRTIAYSAGGVVSIQALDAGSPRAITGDGMYEYGPRFSPDGRSLLVGRRGADGGDLGWWLVPVPGNDGPSRQVARTGAPPIGSSAIAGDGLPDAASDGWTPRSAFDPTGRWLLVVDAAGTMTLLDLDAPPTASPGPQLRIAQAGVGAATWSSPANGFLVPAGSPAGLWAIALDGTSTKVEGTDNAISASIATSGLVVASVRGPGADHASLIVLRPGGAARPLADAPGLDNRWPDVSPDAASVIVVRAQAGHPSVGEGIWVIDPSTGAGSRLSVDGAYARWIP